MTVLLVAIVFIAGVSLVFNAGYIVHELGWYPHTKDRKRPVERAFRFASRYEALAVPSHDFQVMDPNTIVLRKFGHPDVYGVQDPYRALENVIARYREKPVRSRYDDLVHVSNYVCNHVKCDDRINGLIGRIHELMNEQPPRSA